MVTALQAQNQLIAYPDDTPLEVHVVMPDGSTMMVPVFQIVHDTREGQTRIAFVGACDPEYTI